MEPHEHTEYGIPLGWCPKCPNGMGIATGDGHYKCDHCGHVGPDPRSTPDLEPGALVSGNE